MRIAELKQFGLNGKEAMVYLAALEIGNSTAAEVAKKAGLPKSTVHDLLKKLQGHGLVSSYSKKNRKYFAAADPDKLIERSRQLAKQRENVFDKLLPELEAIANKGAIKPRVRFYDSREGIEVVIQELLADAPDEFNFIGSIQDVYDTFPEHFPLTIKRRLEKGIHSRGWLRDEPLARKLKQEDVKEGRKTKLMDPEKEFSPTLWMWDNKATFWNTRGNSSVLIIEDREIIQLIRVMFESMWDHEPDVT